MMVMVVVVRSDANVWLWCIAKVTVQIFMYVGKPKSHGPVISEIPLYNAIGRTHLRTHTIIRIHAYALEHTMRYAILP